MWLSGCDRRQGQFPDLNSLSLSHGVTSFHLHWQFRLHAPALYSFLDLVAGKLTMTTDPRRRETYMHVSASPLSRGFSAEVLLSIASLSHALSDYGTISLRKYASRTT